MQSLKAKLWLPCALCVVYANALLNSYLGGTFQFDDYNIIVYNARVHSWQTWWDDVGHGIRPLLKLTYTFNWTSNFGGGAPNTISFHLTNTVIHLGNTLLVFALTKKFVQHHAAALANAATLPSISRIPFIAGLLFAVHPIHTEAVTYISGRSASLMTLFYLAGLLVYIIGREKNSHWYTLVFTPLMFIVALSVKETAVTFPLALLAWELCLAENALQNIKRHQWTTWLVLLLGIFIFIVSEHYFSQMERSAAFNTLSGNLATQCIAFTYLMQQWFLPLWLNIDPDLKPVQDFSGLAPQLVFLGGSIALMLLTFRSRPWIFFGLAWTFIQLFPLYIFLPRIDIANDRQMYLVSWPLVMALAIEMSIWLKLKTLAFTTAALVLTLSLLTLQRNHQFRSEISLWQSTAQLSPNKARVRNNLGYAYMLAGQKDAARAEFLAALKANPAYYKARNNLARLDATQ